MLTLQQMEQQVDKYLLEFIEDDKQIYLLKTKGEVVITCERALQWVEAGIKDLDCRRKNEMIELINEWIEEKGGAR